MKTEDIFTVLVTVVTFLLGFVWYVPFKHWLDKHLKRNGYKCKEIQPKLIGLYDRKGRKIA